MAASVRCAPCERHGQLEDVERAARVAVGEPRDQPERGGLGLDPGRPEPALGIRERARQDGDDVVLGERLQHVDPAARQQGGVHLEGRVLRRRADQRDGALFHVGQEGVLLRLVEAVDLVDEQDRAAAAEHALGLRLGDHRADLLHAGHDGGERHEARARHVRDELRQRRLARAGRAPEDHRVERAVLEGAPEHLAGADQVLLPHHLVEGARAHPVGERRGRHGALGRRRVEQVHAAIIRGRPGTAAPGRRLICWRLRQRGTERVGCDATHSPSARGRGGGVHGALRRHAHDLCRAAVHG